MNEQRKQILEMLSSGKITVDEAERLITALEKTEESNGEIHEAVNKEGKPKYLHVKVQAEPGSHHKHGNVDIKIPIMLLKAGIKIGSLMPENAKGKFSSHLADKGINFDLNNLNSENIDAFIIALKETSIDIDSDNEKVKIFCA